MMQHHTIQQKVVIEQPTFEQLFPAYAKWGLLKVEETEKEYITLRQSDQWLKRSNLINREGGFTYTLTGYVWTRSKKIEFNLEEYVEYLKVLANLSEMSFDYVREQMELVGWPPEEVVEEKKKKRLRV